MSTATAAVTATKVTAPAVERSASFPSPPDGFATPMAAMAAMTRFTTMWRGWMVVCRSPKQPHDAERPWAASNSAAKAANPA